MNALASGGQFTRQTLAKNMKLHSYSIQGNCIVKGDLYTRGDLVATMPEVDALRLRLANLEIAAGFPNPLVSLGLEVPTLDPPAVATMNQLKGYVGESHALFVNSLVYMIEDLQRALRTARDPIFDTSFHGVYTDTTMTVQVHAAKIVVFTAGVVSRFELVDSTKSGYNKFQWIIPTVTELNLEPGTSAITLTLNSVTHTLTESADQAVMQAIGEAERNNLPP
jgi:hypothetical protein